MHAAGHPGPARRRPRPRRQAAQGEDTVALALRRRRRDQRGRLPRGAELRRRLPRAGGLLRAEQPVRDLRAAGPADRGARRWPTRASATACRASRSTATTSAAVLAVLAAAVERARAGDGPVPGRGAHLPDGGAHQRRRRHPLPRRRRGRRSGGPATRSTGCETYLRARGAARRRRPSTAIAAEAEAHAARAARRHERRVRHWTRWSCSTTSTPSPPRSCASSAPQLRAELAAEARHHGHSDGADAPMANGHDGAGAQHRAARRACDADDRVVVFGEDVGALGGVFRITDGLTRDFGERALLRHPAGRGRHRRLRGRHGDGRLAAGRGDAVRRLRLPGVRADRLARRQDAQPHPGRAQRCRW